jgi:2-amino-4-hydroxy-6-hydroxymethyldihydropteridine diphosphokinase
MTSLYILLGSNLGDRLVTLSQARQKISRLVGEIITTSSLYESAAWGNTNQPDFYNQVVEVNTSQSPEEVLATILKIENELGRERLEKWGPRVIDIDILFYGNEIVNTNALTIPHPGIPNRRFTLLPLAEISPGLIDPISGKTITMILEACTDSLPVTRLVL